MLEKFKYINHLGEALEFGKGSLFANENDLRDYDWSVVSSGDKISIFKKKKASKSIPAIIKAPTAEAGIEMRNKIFEIAEKDILANKAGKIVIGDYYLKCFITGISKAEYLINKQYAAVDLSIQTDSFGWIKETKFLYRMSKAGDGEEHLDFSYDTPFDYKSSLAIRELNNDNFTASNFRIVIYGAVVNPLIRIGNHEYSVKAEVGTNEYLTIDSVEKSIYLTKNDGEKVNCFNNRNKDVYIFEKIPQGVSIVASENEGLKFDITLLEERSEPKWT